MPRVNHADSLQPSPLGIAALAVPLGAVLLWLVGCGSPSQRAAALDTATYPPDFTLVFFVEAVNESTLPRDRQAQHVVTPDRTLRAALGPGVSARLYPPATATLTPEQMARLYRLAQSAYRAEAALPPPSGAAHPAVRYRIHLGSHSRSAALTTTPDRNPAAGDLLDALIRLRGGR